MIRLTKRQQALFWSRVRKLSGRDACWLWTGPPNRKNGYGRFSDKYVHRIAYTLLVGNIPKNLTIDHLCRVRLCVNPDHLDVVTLGENVLRGESVSGINARKRYCIRGHKLSGRNLGTSDGKRFCKTCHAVHKLNASRRNAGLKEENIDKLASFLDIAKAKKRKYHFLTPLTTHCKRGHEYTPENTMTYSNYRGRQCRTCHNERRRVR